MNKIEKEIHKIGREMTSNPSVYRGYADLVCDPKRGILPRCLIYETEGRKASERGCVIVGLNPGRSSKGERAYYRNNGAAYETVVIPWQNKRIKEHPYYKKLRAFVSDLGIKGPILWTELVKCESKEGTSLSVRTIRDDIHRYLLKEIQHIPKSWPLVGAGRRAYEILSFSFPERAVVGVPHPTGSYGHFSHLMTNGHLKPDVRKKVSPIIRNVDSKPTCRLLFFKGNRLQFQ